MQAEQGPHARASGGKRRAPVQPPQTAVQPAGPAAAGAVICSKQAKKPTTSRFRSQAVYEAI